ncbi:DNA/RNA non-specific endonuclease [Emticicia oligotrophica DSM 17448]|uniref:DNA/RNA non-specific endonuclease n=1 Tax=Emticicia oligotrophica (strain DSM 17448 / CIP 109782 / MTCC 6937 / GPTSA100-15) TaxID=929562 RepID=A0ABN4AQY8_EMTOG|nr:DNA/RNA non-specific endonuclease [Emticicia oligotrophica]AFK04828.1 DNA/RNA non-specific endonuclease [Emticicia oligotrophica DSM 17448]
MSHKIKFSSYLLVLSIFVSSCISTITPKGTSYINGFPEGLENASKSSYTAGNVELSGGVWYFEDALIGTTANDTKNESKAIRIRETGFVRMNYDIYGVKDINISYGAYNGDGDSEWELYLSKNSGSSWNKLGSTQKTTGNKLSTTAFNINESGKIRIEIRKISGGANRLNIDDLVITSNGEKQTNSTTPTRDDNLAMGNPSNADSKDDNNYLMIKKGYTLSYNRSKGTANWVSWHLSTAWKGNTERTNNFRADNELPSSWYRVQTGDYTNSGFDRGHLCPSDDRDGSYEDNDETFLMTNIAPQAPSSNRGLWADLEDYCRKIASAGNELYIVAGVYGKGGTGSNGGKTSTLENGKVVVPESFWKVILILPVGSNDLTRVDTQTRVIAVNIPNKESVGGTKWGEYRLSIDDLESITGFDFLSNVPSAIQKSLESRKDIGPTLRVETLRY